MEKYIRAKVAQVVNSNDRIVVKCAKLSNLQIVAINYGLKDLYNSIDKTRKALNAYYTLKNS